jgi:putative endonuclease
MESMGWYVYILQCGDKSFYTGITTNLADRIVKHNTGKASKYTRSRLPVTLAFSEEYSTRRQAAKAESAIKSMSREEKKYMIRRLRISGRHQR